MTELAVVDSGAPDGPPVVWLGSLGSSTAMWDRQVPAFAGEHRCVLIDHPGHGASPPATGPLSSIADLGTDVLAALDRSDVGRAHVLGLSLGAMVAMWLAAEHPERVDRLALLSTAARFEAPEPWHERAATVRAEGTKVIADTIVSRWLTAAYASDHAAEVAAFVAMISGADNETYACCCEAVAAMDLRSVLPAIGAPTLIVAARDDPATPPHYAEVIADGIPGSRLILLGGAHLVNWEFADEVNRILAAHLDGGTDG